MQKVMVTFFASLLLFPAGGFGQESKNHGRTTGQQGVIVLLTGTLRESAINQARLAASTDGTVRAPQSPPAVGQNGSDKFPAVLLGTIVGALAGGIGGCLLGSNAENPDVSCGFYAAPFGFLGAGVGALVGFMSR